MAVFAVYLKGRSEPVLVEGESQGAVFSEHFGGYGEEVQGIVPADKIRTPVKHG